MKLRLLPLMLLFVFAFGLNSFFVHGQDVSKEKTYQIKIVQEVNGDKVVIDTTFSSKEEAEQYLKTQDVEAEIGEVIDFHLDSDDEKNIEKEVMVFVSDDDEIEFPEGADWKGEDGETVIIKKIIDENGEEVQTINVEVEEFKDADSKSMTVEVDEDGVISIVHEDGSIETINVDDADEDVIIKKVKTSSSKKDCRKDCKKKCKHDKKK